MTKNYTLGGNFKSVSAFGWGWGWGKGTLFYSIAKEGDT